MGALRTGAFVVFVLLQPVCCSEVFFTDPVLCYILDGFLVVYCIIATALFFREKFYGPKSTKECESNGIYQELERPKDADPYQVLEKKKKAPKKKKPVVKPAQEKDTYESLSPTSPSAPLSPH
ncbi:T-cell surface glycoprotein CD3 zeta chain-like [Pholidichthys leucotaenia]